MAAASSDSSWGLPYVSRPPRHSGAHGLGCGAVTSRGGSLCILTHSPPQGKVSLVAVLVKVFAPSTAGQKVRLNFNAREQSSILTWLPSSWPTEGSRG